MTSRALSFGSAAEAYERHRPGYPPALVDAVLAYAGRPVTTALEIGAGTGKATREFAARGIAVTATEPDPEMLAELRRHVPASVTTIEVAFEQLSTDATYDLVYAAAAMHWTSPDGRWPRVAAMLTGGGVFASFGGPRDLADPELEAAVRTARQPELPDDGVPSPDGAAPEAEMQWPGTELVSSGLFTDVQQSILERRFALAADDYIAHLATISAYLMLPATTRAQVFERIRKVLPATVEIAADLHVHLARRV